MENQVKPNDLNQPTFGSQLKQQAFSQRNIPSPEFYQQQMPNIMNNYDQQTPISTQWTQNNQTFMKNQMIMPINQYYQAWGVNDFNVRKQLVQNVKTSDLNKDPYGLVPRINSQTDINSYSSPSKPQQSDKVIPVNTQNKDSQKKNALNLQYQNQQPQQFPVQTHYYQTLQSPIQNIYSQGSQKQQINQGTIKSQPNRPPSQLSNRQITNNFIPIQPSQGQMPYYNNYQFFQGQNIPLMNNMPPRPSSAFQNNPSPYNLNNLQSQQMQTILNKNKDDKTVQILKANLKFVKDKFDTLAGKHECELYNITQQLQNIASQGGGTKSKLIFLLQTKKNYEKNILQSRMKQQKLTKLLNEIQSSNQSVQINKAIQIFNKQFQDLQHRVINNWKQLLVSSNQQQPQFKRIVANGQNDSHVMLTYDKYTELGTSFSNTPIQIVSSPLNKSNVSIKLSPLRDQEYYHQINIDKIKNALQNQTQINEEFLTLKRSSSLGALDKSEDVLRSSIRSNLNISSQQQFALNVISASQLHNTPIFQPKNNRADNPQNIINEIVSSPRNNKIILTVNGHQQKTPLPYHAQIFIPPITPSS